MAYRKRTPRSAPAPGLLTLTFGAALCLSSGYATAATLQLSDGRIISGKLGETAGVAEDPFDPKTQAGAIRTTPILVVDDGLRRTYVHKTAVREVVDEREEPAVQIDVWQNIAERGASLGAIGSPAGVTPLDEHGRRIITLQSDKGLISVVQGVTRVTPFYTQLRGLDAEPRSYVWDMRVATTSLPRDTLARVLERAIPRRDFDQRMQVVRLYLQSERYRDAARELERVRADFEGAPEVAAADFDDNLRRLRQLASQTLLKEIELREEAGQHRLVRDLLRRFPSDGVASETLQGVRRLLERLEADEAARLDVLDRLQATADGLSEPAAREVALRIVGEIRERLSPATADRLASFRALARGDALTREQLAAVAISGWLLGADQAIDELPAALILVRVRDEVLRYLTEPDPAAREATLLTLRDVPEATVERVAAMLRRMAPPLPLPPAMPEAEPPDEDAGAGDAEGLEDIEAPVGEALHPGCYELTVSVAGREVRSLVQLPPEYDPLRSYPTIVTLGEIGAPLDRQVDFWAGPPSGEYGRGGQARRRGYVVLSVDWARPEQLRYDYTAPEHAAVLAALRDAMRRVAIDPERVFLTGHGSGGDLAWDMGLAHPDTWAGVVPFLAVADRYCLWYWRNAEHLPLRLVHGELDSDKIERNARELDRYLRPRFDATVVEYRGRGYDPFSDELQRAFDWMDRRRRGAPPDEFECTTMRSTDNYFWWVEVDGLPAKMLVAPAAWPPARGVRPATVSARKFVGNKLRVSTAAERITVWLSPELVDFDEPIQVEHNRRRLVERNAVVRPSLEVLLEDVRTRADRYRPYWAKVESP